MNELIHKIKSFTERLNTIQVNINELKSENKQLEQENRRLKELMKIQNNTIKQLESEKKLSGLTKIVLNKKDKTSLKHTVNHLINEIDDCIRSLND